MRIPIAIAVVTAAAISLATPVQADACADYRLALAAQKAARALPKEPSCWKGKGSNERPSNSGACSIAGAPPKIINQMSQILR